MLLLVCFVFMCSNFLFIKCEDNGDENMLAINIDPGLNCTMTDGNTFTEGQKFTLVVGAPKHINYGWWRLISKNSSKELFDNIKTKDKQPIVQRAVIDKSMEGTWEFEFLMLRNVDYDPNNQNIARIRYNESNYVVSMCKKNVTIVPAEKSTGLGSKNIIIIASCLCSILVAIIVAQAAYIYFLKDKAQKLITLNTHNNLSKKKDPVPDDTARYCSNPGQKMMKAPLEDDDNRDSAIYEDPHITISGNPHTPMQPPQPPAITTMPRTPRPDHNMKIGLQAMLPSARNSPARNLIPENQPPNFQKQKHDHELNLANRPPLPLPNQGHPFLHNAPQIIPQHEPHTFEEVYEEMEMDYNIYEPPPPVANTMPARQLEPPKKVPTGNLMGVKENTLRPWNKPQVTPKPQRLRSNTTATTTTANEFEQARRRNDTMTPAQELEQIRRRNDTMPKPTMTPMQQELANMRRRPTAGAQTNELEEALIRRRNNVMQVPIQSVPDPSAREPPRPRPPVVKPPMPQPVQEEIYYNENQASSDEEWTYEPLKPLNSYDPNIYNI